MGKHLITSALPYINGVKHLGNLVGSLLPADVYARFLRTQGEETLFICATDEHGTPAELAAREEGLPVREYCARMHERQRSIYDTFGISFDHFGRSSSPQNAWLSRHVYERLDANGFIAERTSGQVYSRADGRFLADRYVVGTCPSCGDRGARGDQCEHCGALLDPVDLIEPRSSLSGSSDLEIRPTKHLYLRADALANDVDSWINRQEGWPRLTRSIARKWLDEGLRERCITRDLDWGIAVPREGYEGKVFYVWFDAPIEYIGATKEWADLDPEGRNWRSWWYNAEDVTYTQFMAKDNVPFHTIFWPAAMLGTREPWTLATQIKSFHWLTYYGDKFSTSAGRGVFLDDALDILEPDYWRYFLLAQAPETNDASFTWELLATVVNKDLVGIFGNFIRRTLTLADRHFGGRVPPRGEPTQPERDLGVDVREALRKYRVSLQRLEYRQAIVELRHLWSLGNHYLDACAPWALVDTDRDAAGRVLHKAINLAYLFAVVASPVIPFASKTTITALGMAGRGSEPSWDEAAELNAVPPGHAFRVPQLLFRRITQSDIDSWKERYEGSIV